MNSLIGRAALIWVLISLPACRHTNTVSPRPTTSANLPSQFCEPRGATICVKVVRAADGAPLSAIRIAVVNKSGSTLSQGRTDNYGVGYLPVPNQGDNPA